MIVNRDNYGFILTGSDLAGNVHLQDWKIDHQPFLLQTNIPGIFALGVCTSRLD
jgi:thioredoxin reductase (NADPH)